MKDDKELLFFALDWKFAGIVNLDFMIILQKVQRYEKSWFYRHSKRVTMTI